MCLGLEVHTIYCFSLPLSLKKTIIPLHLPNESGQTLEVIEQRFIMSSVMPVD